MSASTGTLAVLLVGAHLHAPMQLSATDGAPPELRPGECWNPHPVVVPVECQDTNTNGAGEARVLPVAAVPAVAVTEGAQQRAPGLAARGGDIASQVLSLATANRVVVRELVLRADWSEEGDAEHFRGVVLDIFASGETGARFEFWGATSEALSGLTDAGGVELSVMVHAC